MVGRIRWNKTYFLFFSFCFVIIVSLRLEGGENLVFIIVKIIVYVCRLRNREFFTLHQKWKKSFSSYNVGAKITSIRTGDVLCELRMNALGIYQLNKLLFSHVLESYIWYINKLPMNVCFTNSLWHERMIKINLINKPNSCMLHVTFVSFCFVFALTVMHEWRNRIYHMIERRAYRHCTVTSWLCQLIV